MKRISESIEKRIEWLHACSLFSELPSDHVTALAELSHVRVYEPEEILFHGGAHADGLYIIVDGRVKVCRYGVDGREQVLHIFEGGEPCGEVAVFEGRVFPATAEALEVSRSLFILRDDFLVIARKRPELLLGMLAVLSRRLRRFVEMIDDLSLKEVSTRLARHLLQLSEASKNTGEVQLTTSKAMLASRLGAVAETLSRTLARMQRKGVIQVEGRRVILKDAAILKRLAEGEKL
ncbi:MAG: Crp/Fnr family transcriptional regulator [Candidatus Hydrogenedentes bacterium]|nr:Crp/Fnr family transcriptional regulator [Candidatus Hydrogenedentota bacterium]